eukprot:5844211-Amphidinium_carterae.1
MEEEAEFTSHNYNLRAFNVEFNNIEKLLATVLCARVVTAEAKRGWRFALHNNPEKPGAS